MDPVLDNTKGQIALKKWFELEALLKSVSGSLKLRTILSMRAERVKPTKLIAPIINSGNWIAYCQVITCEGNIWW